MLDKLMQRRVEAQVSRGPADVHRDSRHGTNSLGAARLLLILLAGVGVLGSALLVPVGPFSVDDVVYRLMAESTADGRGLFVDTGFEAVRSTELLPRFVYPANGKAASQYPNGHSILTAPLLAAFGPVVFPLVNAMAYIASLTACYALGKNLLGDHRRAVGAALLFGFGTFALEYAFGIWPHILALAFGLWSFKFSLDAHSSNRFAAFVSGLLIGTAMTIRLDVALMGAASLVVLLLGRQERVRRCSLFVLGTIPGLLALSWMNWTKWGAWSPLTYGPESGVSVERYLPLTAAAAASFIVVLFLHRFWPALFSWRILLPLAIVVALALPATRDFLLQTIIGLWVLVVDIRQLDETGSPGMIRSARGAVLYAGGFKKSLLQSAPFLIAALGGLGAGVDDTHRQPGTKTLLIPVSIYLVAFAPWSWHGGQSYNMRYLLPMLPPACILVVAALRRAAVRAGAGWNRFQTILLSSSATLVGFVILNHWSNDALREVTYLTVPLVLAGTTGALVICLRFYHVRWLAVGLVALVVSGICWSLLIGTTHDLRRSLSVKAFNQETAAMVADMIEDSSLVFLDWPDAFYGVTWERDNVTVAFPHRDNFQDAPHLVETWSERGESVYGSLTPPVWARLESVTPGSWMELGAVGPFQIKRYVPTVEFASSP